jgi:hypothetical protein
VDGAGAGQLVRASYPPLPRVACSLGTGTSISVLLKTTSKIVFEPRLGPARSAKRLPLVGGRKTRPLTVWVGLIRKQGSPSNERPHTPWVYSEHPQTEHATLVVLASILLE